MSDLSRQSSTYLPILSFHMDKTLFQLSRFILENRSFVFRKCSCPKLTNLFLVWTWDTKPERWENRQASGDFALYY